MKAHLRKVGTITNFPYVDPHYFQAVDPNRVHYCVADDARHIISAELTGKERNSSNFDGLYVGNWYVQPPVPIEKVRCGGLAIGEDMDRLYALFYYPMNPELPRSVASYDNLDRYSAWISVYSIRSRMRYQNLSIPLFGLMGHEASSVGPEGIDPPESLDRVRYFLTKYGVHGRSAGSVVLDSRAFWLVSYRGYLLAFFPMRYTNGYQCTYTLLIVYDAHSSRVEGVSIFNIGTQDERYNPFPYHTFVFDGYLYFQCRSLMGYDTLLAYRQGYQQEVFPVAVPGKDVLMKVSINSLIQTALGKTTKDPSVSPAASLADIRHRQFQELLEVGNYVSVDTTQRSLYLMNPKKEVVDRFSILHYGLEYEIRDSVWLPLTADARMEGGRRMPCRLVNITENSTLVGVTITSSSLTELSLSLQPVGGTPTTSLSLSDMPPGAQVPFWISVTTPQTFDTSSINIEYTVAV